MGFQVPNEVDALHAPLSAESLPNNSDARKFLFRQCAIAFEDQLDGLAEVGARFLERLALRIGAGQLLDEGDVASFRSFPKDGRQFDQ